MDMIFLTDQTAVGFDVITAAGQAQITVFDTGGNQIFQQVVATNGNQPLTFYGLVSDVPIGRINVGSLLDGELIGNIRMYNIPAVSCPWDLDSDGTVGTSDLLALVMSFGPCGEECPADFNEDGVVSAADLLELLSNFGPCAGSPCVWDVNGDGVVDQTDLDKIVQNMGPCDGCPEDVNGDGMVNGQDVAAVATHFGPCP